MRSRAEIFRIIIPNRRATLADGIVLLSLAVLIYGGLTVATNFASPASAEKAISLAPRALPLYTLYSLTRMFIAYILAILFTLFYGRMAAYNRRAEKVMLPLLDVLQSVPILSFLPVVLLSLSAIMPQRLAAELASIVLIFTSQAWNMTFAWYQSLTTIPKELREASAIFRLNTWMTFKTLELPFAAIPLIWNSMMSWAGGWFFLMAAEIFTVGQKSFHLPGLGAYLQAAASQGNLTALAWGLGTLIFVIIIMDQWIWRPLLAWADHFKIETVESDNPPTSWFYDLAHNARIVRWFENKIAAPVLEWFDRTIIRRSPMGDVIGQRDEKPGATFYLLTILGAGLLIYGGYRVGATLFQLPLNEWMTILSGVFATMLRVFAALAIAMLISIPLGYAIGSQPEGGELAPTGGAGGGFAPGDGIVPAAGGGAGGLLWRVEPGRHPADADGHAVVPDVQHYRRGSCHPAGFKIHLRAAGHQRLGALAHADPAGAVPVHHHRRDHRQRRRVECQHRRRVRPVQRENAQRHRHRRGDRHRHRQRGLFACCWRPPSA